MHTTPNTPPVNPAGGRGTITDPVAAQLASDAATNTPTDNAGDIDAGPGPGPGPNFDTPRAPADLLARAAAIGALSAGPAPVDIGPPGEPGFLPTATTPTAGSTLGAGDLSAGQAPGISNAATTVTVDNGHHDEEDAP
jgi:hypothetical protein